MKLERFGLGLCQAMTAGFMSLATSSYFGSEELRAIARGKKETDSIRVAWNSQVKLEHQHMEWQAPLAVKRSCQNNKKISKHHEEFHLLIYHLDLCFHEKNIPNRSHLMKDAQLPVLIPSEPLADGDLLGVALAAKWSKMRGAMASAQQCHLGLSPSYRFLDGKPW